MAHRIIWLPGAAQDLQEISDFVGQTSRSYADSLIGRILDAVESLPAFPNKGRSFATFGSEESRSGK